MRCHIIYIRGYPQNYVYELVECEQADYRTPKKTPTRYIGWLPS